MSNIASSFNCVRFEILKFPPNGSVVLQLDGKPRENKFSFSLFRQNMPLEELKISVSGEFEGSLKLGVKQSEVQITGICTNELCSLIERKYPKYSGLLYFRVVHHRQCPAFTSNESGDAGRICRRFKQSAQTNISSGHRSDDLTHASFETPYSRPRPRPPRRSHKLQKSTISEESTQMSKLMEQCRQMVVRGQSLRPSCAELKLCGFCSKFSVWKLQGTFQAKSSRINCSEVPHAGEDLTLDVNTTPADTIIGSAANDSQSDQNENAKRILLLDLEHFRDAGSVWQVVLCEPFMGKYMASWIKQDCSNFDSKQAPILKRLGIDLENWKSTNTNSPPALDVASQVSQFLQSISGQIHLVHFGGSDPKKLTELLEMQGITISDRIVPLNIMYALKNGSASMEAKEKRTPGSLSTMHKAIPAANSKLTTMKCNEPDHDARVDVAKMWELCKFWVEKYADLKKLGQVATETAFLEALLKFCKEATPS